MRSGHLHAMNRLAFAMFCALMSASLMSGCANFDNLMQADRLERGYTIVLPGIDGPSIANSNIAQGIANSGLETAIEVHDWTTGIPVLLPVHLYTRRANKRQAQLLADKIVEYQDRYPGRPVHLVAQSGGCGVLLWTLESLPPDRTITSAVMLSAAVSPTYDVSEALQHTDVGLWNFYSPLDVILLAGTVVGGNIDGRWMPGAGAVGFRSRSAKPQGDGPRVHQIPYSPKMLLVGNFGGHWGPAKSPFARDYIAPVLAQTEQQNSSGPVLASDQSVAEIAPVVNRAVMSSTRRSKATRYVVSSKPNASSPYVHPRGRTIPPRASTTEPTGFREVNTPGR